MDTPGENEPIAAIPRLLTPLALLAVGCALIVPSRALAAQSDVLLAILVLLTALGISAADLRTLRAQTRTIAALSILPIPLLGALAWVLGRPFTPAVQHGLLGVGLASAEVASVGLVALAGADATVALGIVAGSLVASAILGPLALGLINPHAHVHSLALVSRFGLVVILPLIAGVAVRTATPAPLARYDVAREGLASLAVVALVYAALSGEHGAHGLGAATAAAALFLLASTALAVLWMRYAGAIGPVANSTVTPAAFTIAMRDFAVAATLGTQAFGPRAGVVPGIYGVLMLIAGSVTAQRTRGR